MSFLKKLAGDAVLYGMSSIIGKMLNWLLVVIHTRVFVNPEMLTENTQLYTYIIPLNIIFTFGMETTFFRFGSKKETQQESFNIIFSFILVLSAILSAILILFSTPIVNAIGFPGKESMIIMMALIIAIDAVCAICFARLRVQNKVKSFVAIRLAAIFINIGLNLFFLVFCNNILRGKFFSNLLPLISKIYFPAIGPDFIIYANYIASALTLLLLWKTLIGFEFRFNWEKLRPIVTYAYPLMILGLAGSINLTADRLMFRSLLPYGFYPDFKNPDQAFSIYGQVYKLSIFMTLVVQAYRYAADPLFFAKMGDKNSPDLIALSTKWFTIASIILWVVVSLNLDWIQLLIGKNYRSAVYIVPILLLANLFIGVYGNLAIWYKLSDNTQYGTYITIAGMTLTVVLNYMLIPVLGYLGCAITFCLSSFLMVLSCYYYGQKYFYIPYEIKSVVIYLSLAGFIIWANSHIHISNLAIAFIYHLIVTAVFVGIVYIYEFKIKKVGFRTV